MGGKIYKISFLFILALVLSGALLLFLPGGKFESVDVGKEKMPAASKIPAASENTDIGPQKPLANPPAEIKAIYVNSESAANQKKMDNLIALVKKSGLNAMVIDIKDSSGYLSYDIAAANGIKYGIKERHIAQINSFIKNLHDEKIYAIARIAVFQDPVLAAERPDLAIKDKSGGKLWRDNKNFAWIDPSSREAWDYIMKIAQDASGRGFDEINFDYIRFPSDGPLNEMSFPFYDDKTLTKEQAIEKFFSYLRTNLKDVKISADFFGLTAVAKDDLGIGQKIEDAYRTFDYVSPMVYPSHYASGFLGYKNPAEYPYEVVNYSIKGAIKKLEDYNKAKENGTSGSAAKVRPWIQAFNLGAIYDISKIKAQIKASDESGGTGWMLWNPASNYSFLEKF